MTRARRSIAAGLALAILVACTKSSTPPAGGAGELNIAAQVASVDLYIGSRQRVLIGLISSDNRFVSYGSMEVAFSYFGADGSSAPVDGPAATASFIPSSGTSPQGGAAPTLTSPSEARGVYQAGNVTFEQAGIWQATITGSVEGAGPQSLTANFNVFEAPNLPAPGQPALKTQNLTMSSKDALPGAIDSRASDTTPVPDPGLQEGTLKDALAAHSPILVMFATPTYCMSEFCGPAVDALEALSETYAGKAVFIHIEIWHDFQKQEINQAAADWLYRDGDLSEPWLYLIDADGNIVDRWGSVFDPAEVGKELSDLRVPTD